MPIPPLVVHQPPIAVDDVATVRAGDIATVPVLANDYRSAGAPRIQDIAVQNDGAWRHSATKYLRQPEFCGALRAMLED